MPDLRLPATADSGSEFIHCSPGTCTVLHVIMSLLQVHWQEGSPGAGPEGWVGEASKWLPPDLTLPCRWFIHRYCTVFLYASATVTFVVTVLSSVRQHLRFIHRSCDVQYSLHVNATLHAMAQYSTTAECFCGVWYSLGSAAEYRVTATGGAASDGGGSVEHVVAEGRGWAHEEKNWGSFFPAGHVWFQGMSEDNSVQVS